MKLSLPFCFSLAAISEATVPHTVRFTSGNPGLLELHKSLVSIPSLTGSESTATKFLSSYLESQKLTVELHQVSPNRHNIYAYPGNSRKTRTLLTSHIDTVTPSIPYHIFPNGTITGRGSNDAKGSIASQITALKQLIAEGVVKEGDVALLYVPGEEVDGAGMIAANSLGLSWESVIFGEPTELKLALGHKGAMVFEVEAFGKAAHSGYPYLGVDANKALVKALYELEELELPGSRLLGETTLNYGLMMGGAAANVVSPYANATVAVRLAADAEMVRGVVDEALEGLGVKWRYFELGYEPQLLDHDVEGFRTAVMSYGTDIPNLKGDHKKYLYGPGSVKTAHSDNEFVTVADLEEAVEGYRKTYMHFGQTILKSCGIGPGGFNDVMTAGLFYYSYWEG